MATLTKPSNNVNARITLQQLEDSGTTVCWVLNNTSGKNQGCVQFQVDNGSGKVTNVLVPHTWVAINLTDQVHIRSLIFNDTFRVALNRGLIRIITEEAAEKINSQVGAAEELEQVNQNINLGLAETLQSLMGNLNDGLGVQIMDVNTAENRNAVEGVDPRVSFTLNNAEMTAEAKVGRLRAIRKELTLADGNAIVAYAQSNQDVPGSEHLLTAGQKIIRYNQDIQRGVIKRGD